MARSRTQFSHEKICKHYRFNTEQILLYSFTTYTNTLLLALRFDYNGNLFPQSEKQKQRKKLRDKV